MSDGNRGGYGNDGGNEGVSIRPSRGADMHDDPNRGPLDRAANAITGASGGVDAAMNHDDPSRGPLDRAENAVRGSDDPNRGPLDRAANAITGGSGGVDAVLGRDEPDQGPFDRAEHALHGSDDPNRGPLDRAANAVTGHGGGTGAMAGIGSSSATGGATMSAMFDTQAEAQRAVADLRSAGVDDAALSVIAKNDGTTTARDVDGAVTDEHQGSVARGILGGGALGAGLGVLALAIPGVGPLVAAGAIAASAVPGAIAIGAAAGAAAGTLNETLRSHGVSEEDASYYGDHLTRGGVLVTVNGNVNGVDVHGILHRNGGHSVANPRQAAM